MSDFMVSFIQRIPIRLTVMSSSLFVTGSVHGIGTSLRHGILCTKR